MAVRQESSFGNGGERFKIRMRYNLRQAATAVVGDGGILDANARRLKDSFTRHRARFEVRLGDPNSDRRPFIERWMNLPRRHVRNQLFIGGEEVMNKFERPWCEATVKAMFDKKKGPMNVVERGY